MRTTVYPSQSCDDIALHVCSKDKVFDEGRVDVLEIVSNSQPSSPFEIQEVLVSAALGDWDLLKSDALLHSGLSGLHSSFSGLSSFFDCLMPLREDLKRT